MSEKQPLNDPVAPPPYPGGAPMTASPSQPTAGEPQGQPPYPSDGGGIPPYQGVPPSMAPPYKTDIPPPPPGAIPVPVGTTTVIINQPFGQFPATCVCPNCQQHVVTQTIYEPGMLTWLIVGLIVLFGGWIFCLCFIPFCIDACKDVRHVCPNCKHTIHVYRPM